MNYLKMLIDKFTPLFFISFIGYLFCGFIQLEANIFQWFLGIKIMYLGAVFTMFLMTLSDMIDGISYLKRKGK